MQRVFTTIKQFVNQLTASSLTSKLKKLVVFCNRWDATNYVKINPTQKRFIVDPLGWRDFFFEPQLLNQLIDSRSHRAGR